MSDLIDRQAVIDELRKFKPEIIPYEKARSYVEETINTMYDRIEELPTVQPEPTDEQVLDYCKKRDLHLVTYDLFQSIRLNHKVSFGDKNHVWIDGKQYISLRRFQEAVKEAQPKEGHWILNRSGAYCCSKCMEPCATYAMMKPRDKFCKMCGSRNEVME
jgi:hypothetical protein